MESLLESPTKPNARHSMTTAEWYTPSFIVEAARNTMGVIDLDPASCAVANETVKAANYYAAADDGLVQPWLGNVFLNPPGGKHPVTRRSLTVEFWIRLQTEFRTGDVVQAVWVGYSLEQLQTLQRRCATSPIDYPICIPYKRIAFIGAGRSPSHANFITYMGPRPDLFAQSFQAIGAVRL